MKKIAFKSIKSRLNYWFLIMGLLPLIIVMIITYIQRVNIATIRYEDKIVAIRDFKVEKLNDWIKENEGDLNLMTGDYEVRGLESIFKKSIRNDEDINKLNIARNLLLRNLSNNERYSEVYIVNIRTGLIELSTKKERIGDLAVHEEYYKEVLKTNRDIIEKIHYDSIIKKPHFAFSKPIICLEHNTHVIGVLVLEIDLDNTIYKILSNRVGLGKTGETILVNKDTLAVSRLRWHKDAPLKLKINTELAIRAINGETGIIISKDYRGEEVLAAYTFIPRMNWGFVSKQDISEINAPIIEMTYDFGILFIVSALVIFIVSVTVSNSISKPIIFLDKTAKRISKGDLSTTTKVTSIDELGSLSKSVNKMILSLKSKEIIQKGVKDVSGKIIEQSSLHQFSSDIINELKEITKASSIAFYVLNELSSNYESFISLGVQKEFLMPISTLETTSDFSKALIAGNVFYQVDYPENVIINPKIAIDLITPKEIITLPIKVEDIVVAFIVLMNSKSFEIESYQIVKQSALNVNTSYSSLISNLRVGILAENVLKVNDKLDGNAKKMEMQNNALKEQTKIAAEANKELEAFAYSVSHDLRAPLRHIDGFTQLLSRNIGGELDEKSQRYFKNIISSSKQMNQLIDDLLTFSRMNRKKINKEKVSMNVVVDEALQIFSLDIKSKKIAIIVDGLSKIKIDASLITYVWTNLLSNAIKFTGKNKKPKIHIGIDKETDESVVFFIKDNGAGFNQKYVNKIFEVFQRLHNVSEFPGTGIGLANVKRIITKHGGTIRAEGKIDKGATFYITLPKS